MSLFQCYDWRGMRLHRGYARLRALNRERQTGDDRVSEARFYVVGKGWRPTGVMTSAPDLTDVLHASQHQALRVRRERFEQVVDKHIDDDVISLSAHVAQLYARRRYMEALRSHLTETHNVQPRADRLPDLEMDHYREHDSDPT